MGTGMEFSSVFDYSSAFRYGSNDSNLKKFNRNNYKSAFTYHSISIASGEETDVISKETWFSQIVRHAVILLLYIFVFSLFPLSAWICIKRVHALERIVLMRLGKLQPIRGPGFAFVLPCIDKWTRVDLRPKTFEIETSELLTADGGIVEVKTDVEYQISDILSYVLKLHQQENTVKELALFCLKNIVSQKDQEDLDTHREIINNNLKDELNRSAISWGLEISNVYIHTVKVLKAGQPVDAVGTLMTALKAAAGHSTQHTAAVFPVSQRDTENKHSVEVNTVEDKEEDFVEAMKKLADTAQRKGKLNGLCAKYKFNIVGATTRVVYCYFENGCASFFEVLQELDCDVTLMLTEDNLRDFLSSRISPLEAYMDGKVMVTGDWSLLRSLAKIFSVTNI